MMAVAQDAEHFWVFGYGSLMWRPGFPFADRQYATLYGYHRALCIQSVVYRGTREAPGLVLGLDHGGSCRGIAYKVRETDRQQVMAYLDHREMQNGVYRARWLNARLECGTRLTVYGYVANHDSPQYLRCCGDDELVRLVLTGVGQEGRALEYLRNTIRHLDEMGINEGRLHRIAGHAEALDQAGQRGSKTV